MNLKRFECFVAVAEELHFGRASVRLNMSQPPLSQQIRALEQELGIKLFERSSRNVRLTPAAQALLPEARALLRGAARAVETARRAHLGRAGTLRVGFVNPAMDGFLSRAVRAFRLECPDVDLVLREMTSAEQLAALRAGPLHLGFVRHGWLDLEGLESWVVRRERYVLALPEGHALSRLGSVCLEQLADIPLVMHPRSTQPRLHDAMIAAFQTAGMTPRIVQEAVSKHTTLSLVAAGLGCALVPESTMAWSREGVRYVAVRGGLPVVEIAVVWPNKPHPAASRLAALSRARTGR